MSAVLQQLIESQRMLLNALESTMRETPQAMLQKPAIVHARQDEMSPEEEMVYMNFVEDERQALLKQAMRAQKTLAEQAPEPEYEPEPETEEEPVLLDFVVGTMDHKDPARGLDQRELMDVLNL